MNVGVTVRLNDVSAALQRDIDRLDELWCDGLQRFGGPFLAGSNFTAVDAFFAPVVFRARTYELLLSDAANAYVARILQLPAMLAWEADALLEPYREEAHEAELHEIGKILLDRRQPL